MSCVRRSQTMCKFNILVQNKQLGCLIYKDISQDSQVMSETKPNTNVF